MTIFDAMKKLTVYEIQSKAIILLAIEAISSVDKETGELVESVRIDCQIPKRSGALSNCQFKVKVPNTKVLKVTNADLEDKDYLVFFKNLSISYIDARNNVYFRADSYDVEEEV